MSKLMVFFITFCLVIGVSFNSAAAVGNEETGEVNETENPENIVTPDSPFYFLKRFIESVRLLLTIDQEKKLALLDELVQERVKEMEALQNMYSEGELSDRQLAILDKALNNLILYAERLLVELSKLEEDESEEPPGKRELDLDKYQRRIDHLTAIAGRAPEEAQKGLARAVANAERQREWALARGKISGGEKETDGEEVMVEAALKNGTKKVPNGKDVKPKNRSKLNRPGPEQ